MTDNKEMRCYECSLCVKDDGQPYCVMKDLYTNVYSDSVCNKINIKGEYYFNREKKKNET